MNLIPITNNDLNFWGIFFATSKILDQGCNQIKAGMKCRDLNIG